MEEETCNYNTSPGKSTKQNLDEKKPNRQPRVKLTKQEQKRQRKNHKEENTLKKIKHRIEKDSFEKKSDKVITKEIEKAATKCKGRRYTVSIAVSGSIVDNAQSPALKAYLAGQIARAAAIFNVDEIVVFDDTGGQSKSACEHMARILQFLECPQYLRKMLFPLHPDLQCSGVISPLDIPHHLRKDEALPYREGVVSSRPTKEGKIRSFVYVGLEKDCQIEKKLTEGLRVSVKFNDPSPSYILSAKGKLKGDIVSPHTPRIEMGLYWGYSVRVAGSLSKVFSQSPFRNGYDVTIGTSEKGLSVEDMTIDDAVEHILIVFGGVEGLEYALENDDDMKVDNVRGLFDHYVNTCPRQGSRTIRTEEAILISMTAIAPKFNNLN